MLYIGIDAGVNTGVAVWDDKQKKLQGVGSVKRDCVIWDEFCKDKKIEYYMQHPKHNVTKLTAV